MLSLICFLKCLKSPAPPTPKFNPSTCRLVSTAQLSGKTVVPTAWRVKDDTEGDGAPPSNQGAAMAVAGAAAGSAGGAAGGARGRQGRGERLGGEENEDEDGSRDQA